MGVSGGLQLSMKASHMLPQIPVSDESRAGDLKTQDEEAINSLHVFFFNGEGDMELLDGTTLGFHSYQCISQSVMPVPSLSETFPAGVTKIKVVAVANLSGGNDVRFAVPSSSKNANDDHNDDNFPKIKGLKPTDSSTTAPYDYEITKYEDLKNFVYCPDFSEWESPTELPTSGMPMIGETATDIVQGTTGNVDITMVALMARVDVNVKLDPTSESKTGLPRMTIKSYDIKNIPSHVSLSAPSDTTKHSAPVNMSVTVNATINKSSNTHRFTYYTYENVRWPKAQTFTYPSPGPNDTENSMKQRWKPKLAKEHASCVVMRAHYVTHQNIPYEANFVIYPGLNEINDFQVKRNHQYVNNVTIRGLDYVTNDENVYSFDARINVETVNALYLAIINERKVDAHASILPMDIWMLLAKAGTLGTDKERVTVTVPSDCDWVRMKWIPRAEMQDNGVFKAGRCAAVRPGDSPTTYRPTDIAYFYDDMVTNCENYGLSNTVNTGIQADGAASRSRIYFYIDENVPTSFGQDGYGDRSVTIDITYESFLADGTPRPEYTHHYSIEIEQKALLPVTEWHSDDGNSSNTSLNTYVEYYEEYLEHSDPLEDHTATGSIYAGLPWGLSGTEVASATSKTGWQIYLADDSFNYTKAIITNKMTGSPMQGYGWYDSTTPVNAFVYCYGKNKRASDGNVTDRSYGWFMPGIRILEGALVQYYNTFPEFQSNFYWSAACGLTKSGMAGTENEDTGYARSTKVLKDGDSYKYVPSNFDKSGSFFRPTYTRQEGLKPRTEIHRIRAFYKPAN